MYLINGKAINIDGKLVFSKDPTVIELEVNGTSFPDGNASFIFQIQSTLGNEMYIDFADGTGVHTFLPNRALIYFDYQDVIMYYYQDLANPMKIGTVDPSYNQRRKIKISFKYPNRVTGIWFRVFNIYGKFPEAMGNYNLTQRLTIDRVKFFDEFPTSFRGINTYNLALNTISTVPVTVLPEWIYNSKIQILALTGGFIFTALPSVTNLYKLINVVGLTSLALDRFSDVSIPDNWKDITTLRTVILQGGESMVSLPVNLTNMTQLTSLTIRANSALTSWGNGIGLMTKLITLDYYNSSLNLTTDVPFGIENCWKLKNIFAGNTFLTLAKINTHISNYYDMVVVYGDMTATTNNKFRSVAFSLYANQFNNFRPSGTYQQPTGYIQGSSNGTPASAMEMCWVLVKQYGWKITVLNSAGTGGEVLQ